MNYALFVSYFFAPLRHSVQTIAVACCSAAAMKYRNISIVIRVSHTSEMARNGRKSQSEGEQWQCMMSSQSLCWLYFISLDWCACVCCAKNWRESPLVNCVMHNWMANLLVFCIETVYMMWRILWPAVNQMAHMQSSLADSFWPFVFETHSNCDTRFDWVHLHWHQCK